MYKILFTDNKFLILTLVVGVFLQSSLYPNRVNPPQQVFNAAILSQNISNTSIIQAQQNFVTLEQVRRVIHAYITYAHNPIRRLYRETLTQGIVKDFLIREVGSQEIVETILFYAEKENIPIEIVFSLVFVESRFIPHAVSANATSQDFGLFQLNSRTFRYLPLEALMQIDTNVKMGIGYLKYAFSLDPDPRIALAIYNAGPRRPLRGMTPESTKKYVAKILLQEQYLTKNFIRYVIKRFSFGKLNDMAGI